MSEPRIVPAPEGAPERVQPPASEAAAPFWEATRELQLVLQWCPACERAIHFPRVACPTCGGDDLAFRPAAGTGTIYACSTMPAPGNPGMAGRAPYVVALIDLPEGVRMLSSIVGDGALDAAVGDPVAIAWEPLVDGRLLPVFVRS
ncbi:MAG: OB-fold domain-containing protein [Acidimicrobiales bacterium]